MILSASAERWLNYKADVKEILGWDDRLLGRIEWDDVYDDYLTDMDAETAALRELERLDKRKETKP